jgi:hypothetical protein
MMGKRKNKQLIFLMLGILFLIVPGCGGGSQTLRIRTDKEGRDSARQAALESQQEQQVISSVPPIANTKSKETIGEEKLEEIADQVMNLMVKSQEKIQEGDLKGAEVHTLRALEIIKSKELYLMLADIYELRQERSKADSCRNIANTGKF